MNYLVQPGMRSGRLSIPASKSQAHRLLICAGLSDDKTELECDGMSKDIAATMDCLSALCAKVSCENDVISVEAEEKAEGLKELHCGESGSTLRFMLPLIGALGETAVFVMEGRLPDRPLAPLDDLLREHGMTIEKEGNRLYCSGRLRAGNYVIPGNISSQYISGLLFALPLLEGKSKLLIYGDIESANYIEMTEAAIKKAGIVFEKDDREYSIEGGQKYNLRGRMKVEQDWSSAAFLLSMGALSDKGITVEGMDLNSAQGDKEILNILEGFGAIVEKSENSIFVRKGELKPQVIHAGAIPDLVPVISVVAAAADGDSIVVNAERLRLKESDRLKTTSEMITNLGGNVVETKDGLAIRGKGVLLGGTVDSCNDHRIAMSAAVAASICEESVTVMGAECSAKSYPRFWTDIESLEIDE